MPNLQFLTDNCISAPHSFRELPKSAIEPNGGCKCFSNILAIHSGRVALCLENGGSEQKE